MCMARRIIWRSVRLDFNDARSQTWRDQMPAQHRAGSGDDVGFEDGS